MDFEYYKLHAKYLVPTSLKGDIIDNDGKALDYIENTNKVNLFVGANNSGKSKIICELLKDNRDMINWNSDVVNPIQSELDNLLDEIVKLISTYSLERNFLSIQINRKVYPISELENTIFRVAKSKNDNISNAIMPLSSFANEILAIVSGQVQGDIYGPGMRLNISIAKELFVKIYELIGQATSHLKEKFPLPNPTKTKIYIPSFRTLHPFGGVAKLKTRISSNYDLDKSKITVESGDDFYSYIHSSKTGEYSERKRIKEFEIFLGTHFFGGENVEVTSRTVNGQLNGTVFIKVGNEKDQPIHDLGDGLQMIIIMSLLFFLNDSGVVIIEEPELYMHPALQRRFLDFLISNPRTTNFQIFISTHSNHFLDLVNDTNLISVFTVRKHIVEKEGDDEILPKFIVENVASGNDNALQLLGVNNTSVYIANCTIWVEGVTDKLYIGRYISEYLKQKNLSDEYVVFKNYQEGIHYSFVFSGGDTIIHWDFDEESEYDELKKNVIVDKLCGKSLVIVDDDFNKNRKRKEVLSEILFERLIVLDVPEIENLLDAEVIIQTIKEYPSLKDFTLPTSDNGKLKKVKVGTYIDDYLLKSSPAGKRFSAKADTAKSKSIKSSDKLAFCEKAIKHISFENMTDESKKLVERIISFVIAHNN